MPVKSPAITKTTISAALADARRGVIWSRSDTQTVGLELRVRPLGVKWSLKTSLAGKVRRWDLGDASLHDIEATRQLAREARGMCQRGQDPTDYIKRSLNPVPETAGVAISPEPAGLTWEAAIEDYLMWVRANRRDGTYMSYAPTLRSLPEFEAFKARAVASITAEDIAEAIAHVGNERNKYTMAAMALRTTKAFFSWMSDPARSRKYNVTPYRIKHVRAPERPSVEIGQPVSAEAQATQLSAPHLPSREEIGRILAIARSGALRAKYATAVILSVQTAQRRRTVASMQVSTLYRMQRGDIKNIAAADIDGWGIWLIPPYFRKTARKQASQNPHVVPLTPEIMRRIYDVRVLTGYESDFIFPAARVRRAGQKLRNEHMSADVLTHLFSYMPGVTASPHDLRRAFTTYLKEDLGYPTSMSSLVLDHLEGRKSNSVTENFYDYTDSLDEKFALIRAWWGWCEEQVRIVRSREKWLTNTAGIKAEIARRRAGLPPLDVPDPEPGAESDIGAFIADLPALKEPAEQMKRFSPDDFPHRR